MGSRHKDSTKECCERIYNCSTVINVVTCDNAYSKWWCLAHGRQQRVWIINYTAPPDGVHCYTFTNCRALDLSCNKVSGRVRVGIAGNVAHWVIVVQQTSYYKYTWWQRRWHFMGQFWPKLPWFKRATSEETSVNSDREAGRTRGIPFSVDLLAPEIFFF